MKDVLQVRISGELKQEFYEKCNANAINPNAWVRLQIEKFVKETNAVNWYKLALKKETEIYKAMREAQRRSLNSDSHNFTEAVLLDCDGTVRIDSIFGTTYNNERTKVVATFSDEVVEPVSEEEREAIIDEFIMENEQFYDDCFNNFLKETKNDN